MINSEKIIYITSLVENIVMQRLNEIQEPILLTYEGTLLDRLALYFVNKKWPDKNYSLICSIRPCMDKKLIEEVTLFAQMQHVILCTFSKNCEIDKKTGIFLLTMCQNISGYIYNWIEKNQGTQIISALLPDYNLPLFFQLNEKMKAGYITKEKEHFVFSNVLSNSKQVFLFKGLFPLDMVLSYFYFVSFDLDLSHIPLCYLCCYNEQEQKQMRKILITYKEHFVKQINKIKGIDFIQNKPKVKQASRYHSRLV